MTWLSVVCARSFLGYSGGKIILAFRGTVEKYLRDWIEDLSFGRTVGYREECPNCAVHSGFLATYSSLKVPAGRVCRANSVGHLVHEGQIRGRHSSRDNRAQPGGCDGTASVSRPHSGWLGSGARGVYVRPAQVCPCSVRQIVVVGEHEAARLDSKHLTWLRVHRVGNQAYIDFYKTVMPSEIFRVTHWRDTVPHLPPEHLLGYVHGPREVFYVEDMSTFRVCDGSGEDPACSDQHNVDLSIDDHLHYLTYVNSSEIFPISLCEPLGGTDSMPM
eukprot:scaffold8046_cov444-Prasinococcus_capsulatus_cf.AAC.2